MLLYDNYLLAISLFEGDSKLRRLHAITIRDADVTIGSKSKGIFFQASEVDFSARRNWRGTAFGGAKGRTDVPKIVDMYMTGKIEIDPMITHVMGLEEINKAFELMHAGKSIRSVVVF